MNLENRDLGDDYLNGTTWEMLPGVPELNIPPPTATGECNTTVIYKFTPPACIKTVRFQITTNADKYIFAVSDAYGILQGKCTNGGDDIIYSLVRSFVLSFTRSLVHSFSRSLDLSFTRSLFLSFTRSLVHSFSLSVVLSFTRSLLHSFSRSLVRSFARSLVLTHTHSLISTSEI